MADTKANKIIITSITCNGTSDVGNTNDEVYIIYQADGGVPVRTPLAPQNMNTQSDPRSNTLHVWDVNLTLSFDHEVLVTLWDQDSTLVQSASDFLVNFDFTSSQPPASQSMSNYNGADYTITAKAA